jgi:DNA-binding NarL/FixJ family response regulator
MTSKAEIRILIADDHLLFREGIRKLLEAEGGFIVVGEATNADEAIGIAQNVRPDVLLLDLSISKANGLEVLRQLAESRSASHILLLTANMTKSEIIQSLILGAQGVVQKHSPSQILFKSIRAVMAGELWISRDIVGELVLNLRGSTVSTAGPLKRFGLTRRELEIIAAVVKGQVNRDIAQAFNISEYTVKHHLTRIFGKLGVTNRVALATFSMSHNLAQPREHLAATRIPRQ